MMEWTVINVLRPDFIKQINGVLVCHGPLLRLDFLTQKIKNTIYTFYAVKIAPRKMKFLILPFH